MRANKLLLIAIVLLGLTPISQAQVKFRKINTTNYFQLGLQELTSLTFGYTGTTGGPQANWSIENWDGGLNFWKPWPSTNSGNYHMFIADNGNVGIGYKPGNYKLDVAGSIKITDLYANIGIFSGPYIQVFGIHYLSDQRLKSNIQPLENSLKKLLQLNGKSYNKNIPYSNQEKSAFKTTSNANNGSSSAENTTDEVKLKTIASDKKKEQERKDNEEALKQQYGSQFQELGLLAQEVQKIFPELVHEGEDGLLSISYIGLIPVIIEALKEQNEQIEVLKALTKSQSNSSNKRTGSLGGNNEVSTDNALKVESIVLNSSLEQNNPNPFSQSTTIVYNTPLDCNQAAIYIYDLNGTQKKVLNIDQKGEGSVTIEGSDLQAGMYLYTLIVDGVEVDTKRMILTN